MQQSCVGLDVHSKQSAFVIADEAGTVVPQGEVPTTPAGLKELRDRHALAPGTPVALGTGTTASFVVCCQRDEATPLVAHPTSVGRQFAAKP